MLRRIDDDFNIVPALILIDQNCFWLRILGMECLFSGGIFLLFVSCSLHLDGFRDITLGFPRKTFIPFFFLKRTKRREEGRKEGRKQGNKEGGRKEGSTLCYQQ